MEELTIQEEKFCLEYVRNGGNGTQAAIDAGYPADTAEETAKALLKRQDIKDELKLYKEPIVLDPPEYWKARAEFEGQS